MVYSGASNLRERIVKYWQRMGTKDPDTFQHKVCKTLHAHLAPPPLLAHLAPPLHVHLAPPPLHVHLAPPPLQARHEALAPTTLTHFSKGLCGSMLARANLCGSMLVHADLCGSMLARAKLCGSMLARDVHAVLLQPLLACFEPLRTPGQGTQCASSYPCCPNAA